MRGADSSEESGAAAWGVEAASQRSAMARRRCAAPAREKSGATCEAAADATPSAGVGRGAREPEERLALSSTAGEALAEGRWAMAVRGGGKRPERREGVGWGAGSSWWGS